MGFRVKKVNRNEYSVVKGCFHCWCFELPLLTPTGQDTRSYHADAGKVRCACEWKVNYRSVPGDGGKVRITTVEEQHTGHHLPTPSQAARKHLRSLGEVPELVIDKMRELISFKQPSMSWLHTHITGLYNVSIDDHLFRNLFRTVVSQCTHQHNEEDWRDAVKWGRSLGDRAFVAVDMDEVTSQGRRLLFMSPAMTYNFHRNNEVIIMDTTHGTNRYRYYLLLILGVSHYGHTVCMAAALLRNQQQDDFIWVFNQIRTFVGADVWKQIKTVSTDGDAAMKVAIDALLPDAFHLRCVWHVQRNIANKSDIWLGKGADEEARTAFHSATNKILFADSKAQAEEAVRELYAAYPDSRCRSYFDQFILPNAAQFVSYSVRQHITFGIQSTQRSESIHSLVKRDNLAYKPLTNMTTAAELMQILHKMADRHEQVAVDQDARAKQKTLSRPATHDPLLNWRPGQSVFSCVIERLTAYASRLINEHFQAVGNFGLEQKPLDAPDSPDVQVWCCTNTRPNSISKYTVTITVLSTSGSCSSNYMHCTCAMPTNYQLPCTHVMAVNLRVFSQPVMYHQIGDRWRRDWHPSTSVPRHPPTNYYTSVDTLIESKELDIEFSHPEDESERQLVSYEMMSEEVYTVVDSIIDSVRNRPALLDIIRTRVFTMKEEVDQRLIGNYRHPTGQVIDSSSDDSDDVVNRLRNPTSTHRSKRQKRFLSSNEKSRSRGASSQPQEPSSTLIQQ
jgi:MULE transposase domain